MNGWVVLAAGESVDDSARCVRSKACFRIAFTGGSAQTLLSFSLLSLETDTSSIARDGHWALATG
ncbi:MAG: hypothetical protein JWP03_5013 [Phycisphaerales bacterium]|nr:hypothetical protein [Phycisphaerales bacterium]